MTTNKNMVKQVLMSIATAGIFGFVFTSCNDDELIDNSSASLEAEGSSSNGVILSPIALNYYDYINSNDVEILNADTTKISVSKALADKLGIESFVGHPMSIWEKMENPSYMRKATKQKLVDDRYIVDCTRCSVAELLNGTEIQLNTNLFVNTDPEKTRTRAAELNLPDYAAKYIDDENVMHPVAVTILPAGDGGECLTRSAVIPFGTYSTEELVMAHQNGTRGWDDFLDVIKSIIDYETAVDVKYYKERQTLINIDQEIKKKIEVGCGENKSDTFNINVNIPVKFNLDYTFILDAHGSMSSMPKFNRFETSIGGLFDFNPSVTIGFSKGFELPEKMQEIELAKFYKFVFTFAVPFPVTVTFQPKLSLKFDASVEGKAYMGIQYHYASTFRFGCAYTNDWDFVKDHKVLENKLSIIPPTGEFSASAGVGLILGCDVALEDVAGPTFGIGPKLTAEANLKISPFEKQPIKFDTSVDIGILGEVGAKLKVWKWKIGEWKETIDIGTKWNLFKYEYPKTNDDQKGENINELTKKMEEKSLEVKIHHRYEQDASQLIDVMGRQHSDFEYRLTSSAEKWLKVHNNKHVKTVDAAKYQLRTQIIANTLRLDVLDERPIEEKAAEGWQEFLKIEEKIRTDYLKANNNNNNHYKPNNPIIDLDI